MNVATQFEPVSVLSSDPLIHASLCLDRSHDQSVQGGVFALRLKGVVPRYEDQAALSELRHPALLQIVDIREQNGEACIVGEYFEGRSLQSWFDDSQLFSIEQIFSMLRQVAAGLDAIHAAGFIHGYLRPASILLGKLNSVKIIDLAVAYQNASPETLLPIASYLSPEYLEGTPSGSSTDRFSLARIAYRLIYQHDPFSRNSFIEEMFCISTGHWDRRAVDLSVKAVFEKALSRVPEMRYQGSLAMVEALEAAWKADISAPTRLSENTFRVPVPDDTGAQVEAPTSGFRQWLVSPRGGIAAAWLIGFGCTLAACVLGFACVTLQQGIGTNRTQAELLQRERDAGTLMPGLHNSMMTVCNSSSEPIEVLDLSSAYWDKTQHLHTFNSASHPHLNWQLSPSSSATLSLTQGETTLWDGSVAFYSMKLRYRGKDYLTSGIWRRSDGTCLQLVK
jgi:serine/threonine protein kinase